MTEYADLHVASNFSFLEGASHPDELMLAAAALGQGAVAVTDRNSLAGVVRAHVAAREAGIRLVVGARLTFTDGPDLLCLPMDRAAYGRLARLITLGRRRAGKGECLLFQADLAAHAEGQVLVVLPPEPPDGVFAGRLAALAALAPGRCFLAGWWRFDGDDARRLADLAALGERYGAPLVATNDVRMHEAARRPLLDVLTCIREHTTIDAAGWRLAANAERRLKRPDEMARLFARHPEAIARTAEIAARCRFSLDELRYEYPTDPVPAGVTPQAELERLTWEGAAERYPGGVPEAVAAQIEREFALIGSLGYAPYFLTVHDIVRFARARGILCQGRGSAANSAVCYCLGITAVDPSRAELLFERFVSAARAEPPDIDVDFEHERREEVIQYLYRRYGRGRAGLAAAVITYRSRSAIRDVGKAMGLSEDAVAALAATVWGSGGDPFDDARVREAGLDPADPRLRLVIALARELKGFPRHLSQHVGGFVLTRGPLDEVVPIENAAMAERTVIQWDKNDLDALGILKIDVLALGMLTCVRKAFDLIAHHHGRRLTLATVPAEDEPTYDMLCRGDSLGVFQVESRAQMAMLPRLQPRNFYDLVIEVAIVRPGPIQGDMVHPYLRRRRGEEKVSFPSEDLRRVLEKTLGVPLFQEQAMRVAIVAAGFTPEEADALRRAMATFRRSGTIHTLRGKFLAGMAERGYDPAFAEQCFRQIEGFGEYGFPESHAASFALLVYVSAWLKRHHPAAFACALLNSQPMGFYAPAQIVRDARAHGVDVRPPDVNSSGWDNALEAFIRPGGRRDVALRLGLRQIRGLSRADGEALAAARGDGFASVADVARRAGLDQGAVTALAHGDAFASLGLDRRRALWAVKGLAVRDHDRLPLFAAADRRAAAGTGFDAEPAAWLPDLGPGEQVVEDYAALRLSLRQHPMALLRRDLADVAPVPAARLDRLADGGRVTVCGLAICRQRPGSANGTIFVTLEDETGVANVIVWPQVFEACRRAVLRGRLLAAEGRLQRQGMVIHVVAERLTELDARLALLGSAGAALRQAPAHGDRLKHNRPAPPPPSG